MGKMKERLLNQGFKEKTIGGKTVYYKKSGKGYKVVYSNGREAQVGSLGGTGR